MSPSSACIQLQLRCMKLMSTSLSSSSVASTMGSGGASSWRGPM